MDQIQFDEKTYVSSKRAAQITGYAKDYVGQLCREGRIEARLVGRNWYVLESSIREHRFGPEAKKNDSSNKKSENKNANDQWEAAKYTSESADTLQTFSTPMAAEGLNLNAATISPAGNFLNESAAVKEMHDAWEDWFSGKSIQQTQQDLNDSLSAPIEAQSEPIKPSVNVLDQKTEQIEDLEDEEVQIPLTRVQEEPVQAPAPAFVATFEPSRTPEPSRQEYEAETVPIHRTYIPPVTVVPPSFRNNTYQPQSTYAPYAPEGRVIRERRLKAKRKPSLILSTLFVAIAIVAVAVAMVGSGKFTQISNIHNGVVQYLEGEKTLNK